MLIKRRLYDFINSVWVTKHGIWTDVGGPIPIHNNVLGVLCGIDGKRLFPAHNLVTDAGDLHYAQKIGAESVTNSFAVHIMCTSGPVVGKTDTTSDYELIAASEKGSQAIERNNSDVDNTGGGVDVITWVASYSAADFNQVGITHGVICNSAGGAGDIALLTGYTFTSSFDKTADDTLKVFVNHTINGV